jgi:hypothetical protein
VAATRGGSTHHEYSRVWRIMHFSWLGLQAIRVITLGVFCHAVGSVEPHAEPRCVRLIGYESNFVVSHDEAPGEIGDPHQVLRTFAEFNCADEVLAAKLIQTAVKAILGVSQDRDAVGSSVNQQFPG